MKSALAFLLFFATSATQAQYAVDSLVAVAKADKRAYFQRLDAVEERDDEGRVLRARLLAMVACRIESEAMEKGCADLLASEDLDGQELGEDLATFRFSPASFRWVLRALIGLVEGAKPTLPPAAAAEARGLLASMGVAQARLSAQAEEPRAGEVASAALASESAERIAGEMRAADALAAELARNLSLRPYVELWTHAQTWLRAQPSGRELRVRHRLSVRTSAFGCARTSRGSLRCWWRQREPGFPEEIAIPGLERFFDGHPEPPIRMMARAYNGLLVCAEFAGGEARCMDFLRSGPSREWQASIWDGKMVDPRNWEMREVKDILANAAILRQESAKPDARESRIYPVREDAIGTDVPARRPTIVAQEPIVLPLRAHVLAVYDGRLFYTVGPDSELRSAKRYGFSNDPALVPEGLKGVRRATTDGATVFCIEQAPSLEWRCWRSLLLDESANPRRYRTAEFKLPPGELKLSTVGAVSVARDRYFRAVISQDGRAGVIAYQRPQNGSAPVFYLPYDAEAAGGFCQSQGDCFVVNGARVERVLHPFGRDLHLVPALVKNADGVSRWICGYEFGRAVCASFEFGGFHAWKVESVQELRRTRPNPDWIDWDGTCATFNHATGCLVGRHWSLGRTMQMTLDFHSVDFDLNFYGVRPGPGAGCFLYRDSVSCGNQIFRLRPEGTP